MPRFLALLCLWALLSHARAQTVIPNNSTWRLFKGRTEASSPDTTAWRLQGFNDATFQNAPAPFSYGENFSTGTVLNDMQNGYNCFFLRNYFTVTNIGEISALQFSAKVDDGFLLWINGQECLRVNMPGGTNDPVTISSLATSAAEPVSLVLYSLPKNVGNLREGTNVVAVQVFNTSRGSSDIIFDSSLDLILADTNAPAILSINPPPGSVLTNLSDITVTFSEPLVGLDADDLNVQGIGASRLVSQGPVYKFTFAQPLPGPVPVYWTSGHGITDRAIPPNSFSETSAGAAWNYTLLDITPPALSSAFPPPNSTVRVLGQLEVAFTEPVQGIQAADLLVNGIPATNLVAQGDQIYIFQFARVTSGKAQFSWALNHGITDNSNNFFSGAGFDCTVSSSVDFSKISITEINAANQRGILDEDGESQDWIELLNGGAAAVDLYGWALTDNADEPGMWVFPHYTLAPGQYLLVFASGKDRKSPVGQNRLHTNFKLGNAGEFLGLFSPDSPRQYLGGFSPKFPEQRNDYSYGRAPDGQVRYFQTPTPGSKNGDSTIVGQVSPVHFSATRGLYAQPFELVLSSATRGATIRYTIDGSEPTESGGLAYNKPLVIDKTTLLRAAAYGSNQIPSSVDSHSYFFNQSSAIRSLPIVSIQTATSNLIGRTGIIGMSGGTGPPNNAWTPISSEDYHNPTKTGLAWERPVSLEYILPLDNSGFQIDAGLRVQGSDWTRPRYGSNAKFSYRLYFRGDYGKSRLEYPLFTDSVVESFDQIVLRAGHNDISNPFLRDELMRQLFADMGQVAGHGNFVNFFINGVYKGYYNPVERVEETFLQSWHGGSNSWDIITVGSQVQGGDSAFWNSLRNYVNTQNLSQPAAFSEVARRMDLVNFIDYLILNTYAATWDWPHNNWRAAREKVPDGKFRFYVWDAEGAMGHSGRSARTFNSFSTSDSGLLTSSAEIPSLYRQLRNSEEFRLLWADRVQKHFFNDGALADERIAKRFVSMRSELLGVIPNMDSGILNSWIPQRRAPLLAQYNSYGLFGSSNAPVFSQHGGEVYPGFSLVIQPASGTGTVYFTTNGVDPRVMFSGAIAGSAIAYSNPVILRGNTNIKARTYDGTSWSALTDASFTAASGANPLGITEIHFNPGGSSAYEFVELQNSGSASLDLSGFTLDGITFTFPNQSRLEAGERLVLVSDSNPNAFALRYPGIKVFGYFSGGLNNGGERLSIKDRNGNIVSAVTYDNSGGWPFQADGSGSSLELLDPNADPDDPANWRASAIPGGSPGSENSTPVLSTVRINEVLADNSKSANHEHSYPDFVELFNEGSTSLDLAGWSLSDGENPRKFVFPAGISISPQGFLVLWADSDTGSSGLHLGFSLDKSGDGVFLYDSQTNRLDAVSFGHQLTDLSIGRIQKRWVLNNPTPNAENQAASVGPTSATAINEISANPVQGGSDWIELFNKSSLPVALKDSFLSNTSAVHQIKSLTFIEPFGFARLFADEKAGADHLNFKLSAAGGGVVFYDSAGNEVNRFYYPAQAEEVSTGRLPDGTSSIVSFPGTSSPGASNYIASYSGPVLSEIMARNLSGLTNATGHAADWIEIWNPGSSAFSLAGFSLSINSVEPGHWQFPPNATLPGNGYLLIWCDPESAVSTNAGSYNLGNALKGEAGSIHLFNAAGRNVDSVEYGFQLTDRSIGLSGNIWQLLQSPSPGIANGAAATFGHPNTLKINEWMAKPASGSDWIEVYNPSEQPVQLSGLFLTDDPASAGTNKFKVPPLSFIDRFGYVRWFADSQTAEGFDHLNFNLDELGETVRIYASNGQTAIDSISFGWQNDGVSQGRMPDGSSILAGFPGSSSPGSGNHRLLLEAMISEVQTYPTGGQEKFVELQNLTAETLDIGGWFLSDQSENLKKFRIPSGTTIAANGILLIKESEWISNGRNLLNLDRARGGELFLSAAGVDGALTGFRNRIKFGASPGGVSFGSNPQPLAFGSLSSTPVGNPVLMGIPTPGAPNSFAYASSFQIHELMVRPVNSTIEGATEYVELRNAGGARELFDLGMPSKTWRLHGAVEFQFPAGTLIPSNSYPLVVPFDPEGEPAKLASFRNYYGVPPETPVFGPYAGRLDNAGETIELQKPEAADSNLTFYTTVERVTYSDSAPWPENAVNGAGTSLQRRLEVFPADTAANWFAVPPTAGRTNEEAKILPPTFATSPFGRKVRVHSDLSLSASASGTGPIVWQWRFNGVDLEGQTNEFLFLNDLRSEDAGVYDTYARNPGGATFSEPAIIRIVEPPTILSVPLSTLTPKGGENISLNVVAAGTGPLKYQWTFKGESINGATNSQLSLTDLALDQSGAYSVSVSNDYGSTNAAFTLIVQVPPYIVRHIDSQTVLQGGTALFSLQAGPEHPLLPLGYRWFRNGSAYSTTTAPLLRITDVQSGANFRVEVFNAANPSGISSPAFATATLTMLADFDRDGVADVWEAQYFGGSSTNDTANALLDSDTDGMINREEFIAGTDPTDPASLLKVLISDESSEKLQFQAQPRVSYSVQWCSSLATGIWTEVMYVDSKPEARTIELNTSAFTQGVSGYFRISIP